MNHRPLSAARILAICTLFVLFLQGCGGSSSEQAAAGTEYFDAPFASSLGLAEQCTGTAPQKFIRSYLDEVYLWPDQVQRRDALAYDTSAGYFKAILAPPSTDRFSFSSSTQDADDRETNEAFDVGIRWVNTGTSADPVWRMAHVEPNSPAAVAGLRRGDSLYGRVSTNLYDSAGQALYYDFSFIRSGQLLQAKLRPTSIFEDPVGPTFLIDRPKLKLGYILFESHYGNAQDQLIAAFQQMAQSGVSDLVLDMRYNIGGYLTIAGTLASMLTPAPTLATRPVFVRLQPNAKLATSYQDAVLRMSPQVQYVANNALFKAGSTLPKLTLQRVYVLTTGATCSASESLINGLRGVGVTVHLIGDTTCGKPYGMSRQDNCGTAYYPIEFRGVNARGESDFANGFSPTCTVPDDLDHARGDAQEAQLKAAITHMETGACPSSNLVATRSADTAQMSTRPLGSGYTPPQRQRPSMAILQPAH